MMAVEPGIDALALGEMGIANTTSAAALCLALFGGSAEEWTGPGTGIVGAALDRKREVVAAAVARHQGAGDPLELLRRRGGGVVCGRSARARPLHRRACLGRAGAPSTAGPDRQARAVRFRHAVG